MRRNPVAVLTAVVGLCLIVAGLAIAAVTTTKHATYALKPCSTCRDVRYPTEQECQAAAYAEAGRVGQTRTTGSAVYTCITRFNVIATFSPNAAGSATLSWTPPTQNTDGSVLSDLAGYRISYGTSSTALAQTVQVANPGATGYAISGLAPGTWYFAVRAYTSGGKESGNSNVTSKTIQ